MRQKLTKRSVEAIVPNPDKAIRVGDTEIPGFAVIVQPTGTRSYIFQARADKGRKSKQYKRTLGRHGQITCDIARQMAKEQWRAKAIWFGRPQLFEKTTVQASSSLNVYRRQHLGGTESLASFPLSIGARETDPVPLQPSTEEVSVLVRRSRYKSQFYAKP